MKLLRKLIYSKWYTTCLNNWFLIAIGIILFLLSWNYPICYIFLGLYLFYLIKNNKIIFLTTIILILLFLFLLLFLYLSYHQTTTNKIDGVVVSIEEKEYYQEIIVQKGIKKILVRNKTPMDITIGMKIEVEGINKKIDQNHLPYGFNYQTYLSHNGIIKIIEATDINIKGKTFRLSILRTYVQKYFQKHFSNESLILLNGLILGDTSGFSDELNSAIQKNGIVHLFAISGLHVSLFVSFLGFILSFFHLKEEKQIIPIIVFLIIYVIITDFSPSILRAAGMYIFSFLNNKYKLKLSSLDRVSILFIILLIYHPYWMYHLGFILSFLVSFFIILFSPLIQNKSNIMQSFLISLGSIIITFPLVINRSYEINLLSPFVNVIAISVVTCLILPASILVCIFPFFNYIYSILVTFFLSFVQLFSFVSLTIPFPHFTFTNSCFYYILLISIICLIKKKKIKIYLSIILISFLTLFSFFGHVSSFPTIQFLDLYNGDSTIITNRNKVIIIDTGDGSNDALSTYLKAKGIRTIDCLILTHEHNDHTGEAIKLIKEFNVHKIIISAYNDIDLATKNVIKVKKGDTINVGNITFNVLHPDKRYNDENDNSIVLYTNILNTKFLFTGDASIAIENKLSISSIDVLKIGHHGSKTSTSETFIKNIHPKYAIIMTGRVSTFAFPDQEVIDILNKYHVIIYRTDLDSTITLKKINNQCIFQTMR